MHRIYDSETEMTIKIRILKFSLVPFVLKNVAVFLDEEAYFRFSVFGGHVICSDSNFEFDLRFVQIELGLSLPVTS